MKHVIEVPAGHTVLVTREGLNIVIESHTSSDGEDRVISMSNVQELTGASATVEEIINAGVDAPKAHEPGTVLVRAYRKPYTENEKIREFIVYGSEGKIACTIDSEKVLKINPEGYHSDWYTIRTAKIATPAEREELLNNLRDWYALAITETGELVNWRAEWDGAYRYVSVTGEHKSYIDDDQDGFDGRMYDLGNYFPEGFLTDERLSEYKATVQKLFNKWRGLCPE